MLTQYKAGLGLMLLTIVFIISYWFITSSNNERINLSNKINTSSIANSTASNQLNNKDEGFLFALQEVNNKLNHLTQTIGQIKNDVDSFAIAKTAEMSKEASELTNSTEDQGNESSERQAKLQEQSYEERFLSEQNDPAWSNEVEKQTLDAFAQVSDTLTGVELDCKSSICKLNMSRSNDLVESDEVFEAFESSVDWEGEMYVNYNPETGEGTAYLARPGSTLKVEGIEEES